MWFGERNRLHAAVLSDQAVVFRRRGAVLREWPATATGTDEVPWRGSVNALQQGLVPTERNGARSLSVVLGAAFVRWQYMAWPSGVSSPSELDAALRMRLRAVHGSAVNAWTIRAARPRPGAPVLASAIDTALIDALQLVARQSGLRLDAVRPYVSAVLDQGRALAGRGPAWHVVLEPDHLSVCLSADGVVQGLRTLRCDVGTPASVAQTLASLQSQMSLASAVDVPASAPVYVGGPGSASLAAAVGASWRVWRTGAPAQDGFARVALGC